MVEGKRQPKDAATGRALRAVTPLWLTLTVAGAAGFATVVALAVSSVISAPVYRFDPTPVPASLPTASPTPSGPVIVAIATEPPTPTPEPPPTAIPPTTVPRCRAGEAVPGEACREPFPIRIAPPPTAIPAYPPNPTPGNEYIWRGA